MMNNSVHSEEEDDGDIGDSVSFDLQDENSYIIQLEQFPPLPVTEVWRNGILVGDTEATGGIRQGCTWSPQL